MVRSGCLEEAAVERAEALVGQPLEHRPLTGVVSTCVPGGRVAENLVRSSASPEAVVDAWLKSPGHRNNLLDPALRVTGVGCARDADEVLCAQLFADRNH